MSDSIASDIATHFEQSLIRALKAFNPHDFLDAWQSCHRRTEFYGRRVFPLIAEFMGLKHTNELFRVDYMLHKNINGIIIPIIAVESENYADKTHEEMQKLIALSSPVKALIKCAPWIDNIKINLEGSVKAGILKIWGKYLNTAHAEGALHGIFLFYVAEGGADGVIRYYAYHTDRNILIDKGEIFSIIVR